MMQTVRTTVTIDPATEALLREEVARAGASFKAVLNESIRRGRLISFLETNESGSN